MAEIIKIADITNPACIKTGKMSMDELREKAEALALVYNDCVQSGNFAPKMEHPVVNPDGSQDVETVLIDDLMNNTVAEYTSRSCDACFAVLMANENPMLAACIMLQYPSIRIVDKRDENKIPIRTIEDAEKYIDLLRLHKKVNGGIGNDKNWHLMIEKLNLLMTAQKAIDLGINPKSVNDSYAMSDIAKAIDLGKTPTSKTNILKTVQMVVSAMIGEEYKATSHDVNFLFSVYSKKNRKALTVSCANHKYMRQYVLEICHRIVTGASYELDYKKIKNA